MRQRLSHAMILQSAHAHASLNVAVCLVSTAIFSSSPPLPRLHDVHLQKGC